MPYPLRYYTTIIAYRRVEMYTLFFISIFIIKDFYQFSAQKKYIFSTIGMPMNWHICPR